MKRLPTPRQKRMGRKKAKKTALVCGILQVLVNGVAWRKIAWCGCSYASCFRYFQEIQRRGKLKLVYELLSRQKSDITNSVIDTTTIDSFEFKRMTGWDGWNQRVGVKVSLLTGKE